MGLVEILIPSEQCQVQFWGAFNGDLLLDDEKIQKIENVEKIMNISEKLYKKACLASL